MDPNSISATFKQHEMCLRERKEIETASLRFSQIEEVLNNRPKSRLISLALTEIEKAALVVNKAISHSYNLQESE